MKWYKKQTFNNHSGLVAVLCLMPLVYCLLLDTAARCWKWQGENFRLMLSYWCQPSHRSLVTPGVLLEWYRMWLLLHVFLVGKWMKHMRDFLFFALHSISLLDLPLFHHILSKYFPTFLYVSAQINLKGIHFEHYYADHGIEDLQLGRFWWKNLSCIVTLAKCSYFVGCSFVPMRKKPSSHQFILWLLKQAHCQRGGFLGVLGEMHHE